MPDRKGATLLEDLPEEIIDMILVRLPSKDVGRCRAVSTSWRSATSTSEFMLEHHRRQPLLPIINGRGRPSSYVLLRDARASASSQQLWPFLPGVENHWKHGIFASCDGFLIRYNNYNGSGYYICNPVICKEALLPWPQGICNKVVGFYQHHQTGEYRVLWVSSSKNFSKCSLYIHTVGSNEPRHVKVKMPAVSSPSMEQKLLKELQSYPEPVQYNGNLYYWRPHSAIDIMGDGGDIIVFDTEAESFRSMRSPYQLSHSRKLFVMNGRLAFWGISTRSLPDIDIWVMQDYESEIWAVKYRIDVVKVEASRQLYLSSSKRKNKAPFNSTMHTFLDMIPLNERELLIMFNNKLVLRCDIDGKFLGMVNIGKHQYCMLFTRHLLRESIIPIPSHEV